jgi:ribose transport system substrate-binding protein
VQPIKLLWMQILLVHPVHRIMQAGFTAECKKLGVECTISGSDKVDIPETNALGEAALAKGGYKGVALYAYDPATYPEVKKLGVDQKYPVVSWHQGIPQGAAPGLLATAGTDAAEYAKNAAIAIGQQINCTGTVALTEGSFNTVENLVAKTFTDTMKAQCPNVKVLPAQEEGFDPPKAAAKAVSIIQAHPDIVAAMGTTGGSPATWANAQKQTGKKLVIIGMDYVRQNLDLVKSGEVYAIVAQPLYAEAAKAADLLVDIIKGKSVSYANPLPAPIVTKADIAPYYAILDQAGQ